MSTPTPESRSPWPFFVLVYLLSVPFWLIGPLAERLLPAEASLLLGIVWASLHIVPDMQAYHTLAWITWQRLSTVVLRVLIVWLYNNTGHSVFAATAFHATDTVSFALFPNGGSHYDPFFTLPTLAFTAVFVIFVWGPATLARNRYAATPRISDEG